MMLDYKKFDLKNCSRDECESVLEQLRAFFRLEQSEEKKLDLQKHIILMQRRLTKFRIDNIKRMLGK
jgi:hypothetical protein